MKEIKKYIKSRVRAIARAIKNKPVETLTVGVEIKRCDECPYKNKESER